MHVLIHSIATEFFVFNPTFILLNKKSYMMVFIYDIILKGLFFFLSLRGPLKLPHAIGYCRHIALILISSPGQKPWELMVWYSVCRPSSIRPVSTFYFKRLLLKNYWANCKHNLVGNMPGGWGFRFVQINGLDLFRVQ